MGKPELARSIGSLGIVVFVATLVRLGFLARSMQGENKSGAAYASFAEIFSLYFARVFDY